MSLKMHEVIRLGLEPFLPPLYKQVRLKLLGYTKRHSSPPKILDVGGRKSPYTLGLQAKITISDLPRESDVQKALNLGINNNIIEQVYKRRSNVEDIVLDDMTCSKLPSESFDYVIAVEVLEHVEKDDLFVKEVYRVLKPKGIFLMTTPNGDWLKNINPDHKRHYKRKELHNLLSSSFDEAEVEYAIAGGKYRRLGLKSWSMTHPIKTALSMFGNVVNTQQSKNESLKHKAEGTYHLIATAKKI